MERIIIISTFVVDNQRGYQNFKTNKMKQTFTAETTFTAQDKKAKKEVKIEIRRFGRKDAKNTKELFWITTKSEITKDEQTLKAMSIEDLKEIVERAENLIRLANGEDI